MYTITLSIFRRPCGFNYTFYMEKRLELWGLSMGPLSRLSGCAVTFRQMDRESWGGVRLSPLGASDTIRPAVPAPDDG
jgi:hypothetical protein